jgi:hypothetical protein
MKRMAFLLFVMGLLGQPACIGHVSAAEPSMKKAVSDQASFIVTCPRGGNPLNRLKPGAGY